MRTGCGDVLLESLEKGDLTGTVSCPVLDSEAEGLDLQAVAAEVQQEPVNATLDPADNYSVVPAVPGLTLDIEEAQEAYDKAAPGSEAVILLDTVAPEISTEDLEANLFQDVLGSYQSTASGNGGREHNIALAVSMCDGIIVMPGEIFSYNGIIGETSVEQGFAYANAYSEGSVVQEPGGGVLPGILHHVLRPSADRYRDRPAQIPLHDRHLRALRHGRHGFLGSAGFSL